MKLVKSVAFYMTLALSCAYGIVEDTRSTFSGAGVWTTDLRGAQNFAKSKDNYFLLLLANNQGGCGMCNGAADALFNKAEFKNWARDNDVALVVADTITGGSGVSLFQNFYTGSIALPALAVVDGASGTVKIAMDVMHSGTTMLGKHTYPKTAGSDGLVLALVPDKFLNPASGWLGYVLGCCDNAIGKGGTATLLNPTVRVISADERETASENLFVHGMWDTRYRGYGINSLSHTCYAYGSAKCKAHGGDQFDWYQVQNAVVGKSYELKAPHLSDENGLGRVCLFEDAAVAKTVTSFSAATNKASRVFSLSDLANGVTISPTSASLYLLFTRPDIDKNDTVVITYTFTLQECNNTAYSFAKLEYVTSEDVGTLRIPVSRSANIGSGKVDVKIEAAGKAGFVDAVEGPDGDYTIADKTIEFANGESTAYVTISINRGTQGLEKPPRAFKVRLLSDNDPEDGYLETTVQIYDVDGEDDPEVETALFATTQSTNKLARLNGTDVLDSYVLSNSVVDAGSVYAFAVDPVEGGFVDFADGRVKVRLKRGCDVIAPEAGAEMGDDGFAYVSTNNYVFYLFGSDSKTGGDVNVEVARELGKPGEFPNVAYKMTWLRFDRPVVAFEKNDEIVIPRNGAGSVYNLPVVADKIAPITNYVQEAFAIDVGWCTTNGANAAVAGVDYEAVAPTNCTFTTDSASVSVNVLSRDALLYPELTFMATLLDDTKDYMYQVDNSHRSVTFRFEVDSVEPGAPGKLDASAAGWPTTVGRNLSYTNLVDWIKIENVVPSVWEYEYTTNYLKTVTNDVLDAEIKVSGEGETATTNFTARVEEIRISYTDTVHFDGTLETVTNSVSYSTNDYSVVAVDEVKSVSEDDWPNKAEEIANRIRKGETTVRESDKSPSDSRVAQRTFYRMQAQDVLIKPTGTELTVDVCTNRSDDAKALFSTNLSELVFGNLADAKAPVIYFDELGADSNVWLRVSRAQNENVRAEYKLLLREWEKPVFRFAETSVETNDTVATFDLTLVREGNVSDEVTVKVVSTNETAAAGGDYFSVPETVTFAANKANASLKVTITDPEWNALAWTGDRVFSLSLGEVYEVEAFDFNEASNKVTVTLKETDGSGLDVADGFDETRGDVTTNDVYVVDEPGGGKVTNYVAIAIAADGTLTNLVRTLNGCAAEGYAVNDTNDWFRFSGIETSETYCFKAIDCLVSNAEVKAEFYIGDSAEATKSLTLEELKEGWRYTAETNADVFVRIYRDQSDKVAAVNYTLVAYKYIWPVVSFASGEVTVTNTSESVLLTVLKSGTTNDAATARIGLNNGGRTGWVPYGEVYDGGGDYYSLEIGSSETNAVVEIALNGGNVEKGAWTGDWKFNAILSVDTNLYRYGAITNVLVTVVDSMEQKDATDPDDDTEGGAADAPLADDGSLSATNHLNGIDVAHYGVIGYSDTNDWLRITGIEAENTYRITIASDIMVNIVASNLFVEVRSQELMVTKTCEEIAETGILVPCPTADDILVRVGRAVVNDEVPVSVRYELKVEKIDWPSYSISAEADEVSNADGSFDVVVTRADNLTATNKVVLSFSDTNDVKVAFGELKRALVFEPGVSSITQSVDIVGAEPGFWKRGGMFSATLTRTDYDPYVTIADPSNVVVTVVDASGILENDYPADDTKDGAQGYTFSKDPAVATNYCAAGQSPSALGANWLNGGDTNDWYKFDGTTSNKTYRFSISGVSAVNADGLGASVTVYDADMTERGVTNLADLAKWDFRAVDENGFYVSVSRAPRADSDVSVRYVLSCREIASVYAEFAVDSVEVSEAADAVYVDVVCRTGEDEPLEQDAVAVVNPVEDDAAAYPASEIEDFDPTPIVVTWPAGTIGGVQRVRVPLANYDGVWEGAETFLLELEPVSEIEIGTPDVMTVTVVDKDPPVYGTVGIVDYGETTVREGGTFPVSFTRVNGDAGAVTGKFSWAVGKAKTEQTVVLFKDREVGAKTVNIDVPANTAFALSQSATMTFSLVAAKNTVALTKGSTTKVALTVLAANYGSNVSEYAAGDATKPAFRASDTAWYAGVSDGTLVAATPAKAGGTSVMSVPLTGPCTLTFDVAFANAANCQLVVKEGANVLATLTETTAGAAVAVEAYGTKTVQFVFDRGKTGTSDLASVEVSNISVVRSDDANRIGTYTGAAEIDGKPGYATMTVAAGGKFSAKFTCADRVWTVSGKNPWGGEEFVAKSGGAAMPVEFALDAAAGSVEATSGGAVIATLSRNCWGDKPLSAPAAAALEKFVGYYTVALAPENGDGYGSGYLGVTVSKNGSVKASGVLADGQSVTITGTLALDAASGEASVPLFAKPLAYNGGWLCDTLLLACEEGCAPSVIGAGCTWTRCEKSGEATFERLPNISGGWYDKTENLYEAYVTGLSAEVEERRVPLSFSETGKKLSVVEYDGMFTASFTRATGLFSGYVREDVETAGRSVRKSYRYRGMLTPNAPGGGVAGRGFFLRGAESVDVVLEEL